MDIKQLEKLVSFMREQGLTFLRTSDVELRLTPEAPAGPPEEMERDEPNYNDLPSYEKFARPYFDIDG